jgi:hypothetical protein
MANHLLNLNRMLHEGIDDSWLNRWISNRHRVWAVGGNVLVHGSLAGLRGGTGRCGVEPLVGEHLVEQLSRFSE